MNNEKYMDNLEKEVKELRNFANRAETILHNMALENKDRMKRALGNRWAVNQEPLRNDAARLLKEYNRGFSLSHNVGYVGYD